MDEEPIENLMEWHKHIFNDPYSLDIDQRDMDLFISSQYYHHGQFRYSPDNVKYMQDTVIKQLQSRYSGEYVELFYEPRYMEMIYPEMINKQIIALQEVQKKINEDNIPYNELEKLYRTEFLKIEPDDLSDHPDNYRSYMINLLRYGYINLMRNDTVVAREFLSESKEIFDRYGNVDNIDEIDNYINVGLALSQLVEATNNYNEGNLSSAFIKYNEAEQSYTEFAGAFEPEISSFYKEIMYNGFTNTTLKIAKHLHNEGNLSMTKANNEEELITLSLKIWDNALEFYNKTINIYDKAYMKSVDINEKIRTDAWQKSSEISAAAVKWSKLIRRTDLEEKYHNIYEHFANDSFVVMKNNNTSHQRFIKQKSDGSIVKLYEFFDNGQDSYATKYLYDDNGSLIFELDYVFDSDNSHAFIDEVVSYSRDIIDDVPVKHEISFYRDKGEIKAIIEEFSEEVDDDTLIYSGLNKTKHIYVSDHDNIPKFVKDALKTDSLPLSREHKILIHIEKSNSK